MPRPRSGWALPVAGLVLALAVIGVNAMQAWNDRRLALEEAAREAHNSSFILADHSARALQSVEILQHALAERLRSQGVRSHETLLGWATGQPQAELLRDRIAGIPQLGAMLITDADGHVLVSSRTGVPAMMSVGDRDYFQALRAGAARHVGRPLIGRITAAPSLHIARALQGAQGEFLGALVAVVPVAYFETLFQGLALRPGGSLALLDEAGVLVARHPPLPGAVGRDLSTTDVFRLVDPGGSTARLVSAIDGRERLYASRLLPGQPFRVEAGIGVEEALAGWREQALRLGAGAVLLLLVIGAAIGLLLRRAQAETHAVAERRAHRRTIDTHHAEFRATVEGMTQGIWKFGAAGRMTLTNGRCADIIGLPRAALRHGTTLDDLALAAEAAGQPDALAALARLAALVERREPGRFVLDLAQGGAVSIVFQPLADGGWVATFEDISARRAAEARLHHLARHDSLTGLANRAALQDHLGKALERAAAGAGEVALLYLDLDRFKTVNDSFGHGAGDTLLWAAAGRIQRELRATRAEDGLVARLGGDEFVLLLGPARPDSGSTTAQAALLARRLIAVLSEPFELHGAQCVVGASVGVALHPKDGATGSELLQHADLALYRAKQEGGGRFRFFEPALAAQAKAKRLLEVELRRALEMPGTPEFEMHYQPCLRVATRALTGFEALMRWRHPERGMISPADFVPMAEEIGLIAPLGALALHRACEDAARWPAELRVAVNLSPAQFRVPGLLDTITGALRTSGLDPRRLELEITEGVLLQASPATLALLHRLRGLGLRIAMDDFGTGYSSLSYLRSFPFDKVKIDRAFVREVDTRPQDAAILRAVTTLCERLGITTTAEGVETEAQFRHLAAERCTEAQGFLFSPAVPAAELPALIARLGAREPAAA